MAKIRLWKLGNAEKNIVATKAACDKLAETLANMLNGSQEIMDIVWDDMITVQEIEVGDGDLDVVVRNYFNKGNENV